MSANADGLESRDRAVQVEPAQNFNIFAELEAWAGPLEVWQQCALSKLVSKPALEEADRALVFEEFLQDRGLVPATGERCKYHLNAPEEKAKPAAPVVLEAIHEVIGVNALTPDQVLTIGPNLTVVYGPNGSGKSGYARVLKASCFTRSKSLTILGNINRDARDHPPISAVFTMADGSISKYEKKKPSTVLRDNFAVFDSSCIRVHTDERKSFVVTPYLFDVFPRMAEVIADVNARMKALRMSRTVDAAAFAIPDGKSQVATLLSSLTARTDVRVLKELGTFDDANAARVVQLSQEIEQLKKSDPQEIIKKKTSALTDMNLLGEKLRAAMASLSLETTQPISTLITELRGLREQATALSAASFHGEPLQPIGTPAWTNLLKAALAFNAEAYPGHPYPAHTDDVRCVLCQQNLGEEAAQRLNRFSDFMKSDIERKVQETTTKLLGHARTIDRIDLQLYASDSAFRRTADEMEPGLSEDVDALLATLVKRKETVLEAVKLTNAFTFEEARSPALKRIRELHLKITGEIDGLKTKDVAQVIKQHEAELALLTERKLLAGRLKQVLEACESLAWLDRASKVAAVSPKFVTDMQKQLMTKLVATGFRERFRQNCEELGLKLPIDFKIRGSDGETDRQLGFETVGGSNAQISDVLSEGEQTVVALADFLTEVSINDHHVGVILDDPVSSMDHMHKESIAKRLVHEATMRQVIIFTHDILFSHHLANEAALQAGGFQFYGRTVSRNHAGDIGCIDHLVFPHSHYEDEALHRAEYFLTEAKKTTGGIQHDHLEKGCGCLRTAYEDFIQKQLFSDVVRRWRENIKFTVADVFIPDQIGRTLDERMGLLSRYIDAHSHSPAYHEVPLTVDVLAREIEALRETVRIFKKDKKQWKETKDKSKFL
jgi:ABC-type cobalamin/Fe3+-siderophores transport system ATPase subunit